MALAARQIARYDVVNEESTYIVVAVDIDGNQLLIREYDDPKSARARAAHLNRTLRRRKRRLIRWDVLRESGRRWH